jgi:hypothetical protein
MKRFQGAAKLQVWNPKPCTDWGMDCGLRTAPEWRHK